MFAILHALHMFVADMFKPRCRLEAENMFLRYQLNITLRRAPSQPRLHGSDRCVYRKHPPKINLDYARFKFPVLE